MEGAVLGYLFGLGTVAAVAKRRDTARSVVAWTARQAGWISGRVSSAIQETSRVARDEFERARLEQLRHGGHAEPVFDVDDAGSPGRPGSAAPIAKPAEEPASQRPPHGAVPHLNGN